MVALEGRQLCWQLVELLYGYFAPFLLREQLLGELEPVLQFLADLLELGGRLERL